MKNHFDHDHHHHATPDANDDGINRRGFLECMAWAGTGVLWMMSGGILKSYGMSQMIDKASGRLKDGLVIPKSDFSFVQISDSHIGFSKAANPGMSNYITLYTTTGKLVVYLTIKGILEKLPSKNFIQVHKSAVINLDKINSIDGNMLYIGEHKVTIGANFSDEAMKRILGDRFLRR